MIENKDEQFVFLQFSVSNEEGRTKGQPFKSLASKTLIFCSLALHRLI